jgi:hypothetical protein
MNTYFTSNHAVTRATERTGFSNEKTSTRFIKNALERGYGADQFTGKERDYLLGVTSNGRRAIVYNSFCHIVSPDNCCITVFSVPKWFGKTVFSGKEKVRHPKKYTRYNDHYDLHDEATDIYSRIRQ